MKILIATDGSTFSENAVEKCREFIPKARQTQIKIISVVEGVYSIAAEPFVGSTDYYIHLETELRNHATKAVAKAEKIIKDKFAESVSVQTEVIPGNVKEIIIDEAQKFEADVIVVGSHGYGFLSRVLLGSISDFVVHHAPCSVLVVREDKAKDI